MYFDMSWSGVSAYGTIGRIGVPSLWILGRSYNLGGCVPVGLLKSEAFFLFDVIPQFNEFLCYF